MWVQNKFLCVHFIGYILQLRMGLYRKNALRDPSFMKIPGLTRGFLCIDPNQVAGELNIMRNSSISGLRQRKICIDPLLAERTIDVQEEENFEYKENSC